jgi:hypothetical protein
VIKSRKMKCVWHVTQAGEMRNSYRISVRKDEGKRPLDADGRLILGWTLEKQGGNM